MKKLSTLGMIICVCCCALFLSPCIGRQQRDRTCPSTVRKLESDGPSRRSVSRASTGECIGAELTALTLTAATTATITAATTATIVHTMLTAATIVRTMRAVTITTIEAEPQLEAAEFVFAAFDIVTYSPRFQAATSA